MTQQQIRPGIKATVRLLPLADWLPEIVPSLKALWADYMAEFSAKPAPPPNLTDWLTLLHVAETTPPKISHHLSQLLRHPKNGTELQNGWVTLTELFTLTFAALQTQVDHIPPGAWQSLLTVQNQVMTAAATGVLVRPNRPSTDILTRRANYLQTITDINKKIVAIRDAKELLDRIVRLVQRSFSYQYVTLFLFNPNEHILTLHSAIWQNQQDRIKEMPILTLESAHLTPRAAATKEVVWHNDLAQAVDITPHPVLSEAQAQISVPLLVDNRLLGVLEIVDNQPHAFTRDDRQILLGLANHIAIAIKNVQLQNVLQRHLREQTLLYESNVVLGTSLDIDTVLQLAAQAMAEMMGGGACVISRIDKQAQTVTPLVEYILAQPDHPAHTYRKLNTPISLAEDPLTQQVLKINRPVIDRVKVDDKVVEQSADDKAPWGIILALPFELEKQKSGLIELYDNNPRRNFSVDDIQLCQIMATQTTLALKRASLFDETRQRLTEVSTLYTMTQKIAGNLDLQTVMDEIVVALRQVIGCRGCCIFLLNPAKDQLEIQAAAGLKPHWKQTAKLRVGEGVAGRAVAEQQTIYLPDTQQDPTFIFFDKQVRSLLVMPLRVNGQIIGTINVDDNQPNAFGAAQEQLLTIAATQVGIAIENARLFSKISAEQQQTQAIIQYMADGLLVTDSQGVIITCNPALATMLNLPLTEIIGQVVGSAEIHPKLASVTAAATYQAQTGVLAKEIMLETPTPKILRVFSSQMINDNSQTMGEVRVVHDITKERNFDQLKNDFISTISHELRTPLFSIQGFVQILLEDDADLDPTIRREFLTTIHTQAIQLSEMVNNLLDMARFDEGKLDLIQSQVDVLHLLNQVSRKLWGFAHQQNINLIADLPPALPIIIGDAERLEQVLTNLIGNAIKFTPEGGQVSLTASASASAKEILVEVKDSGIGIPPLALEQVFSRYYQVPDQEKPSARGSGLGLHIAKTIVEGHGGRIWAESSYGEGSIFRFTLPLSYEN